MWFNIQPFFIDLDQSLVHRQPLLLTSCYAAHQFDERDLAEAFALKCPHLKHSSLWRVRTTDGSLSELLSKSLGRWYVGYSDIIVRCAIWQNQHYPQGTITRNISRLVIGTIPAVLLCGWCQRLFWYSTHIQVTEAYVILSWLVRESLGLEESTVRSTRKNSLQISQYWSSSCF